MGEEITTQARGIPRAAFSLFFGPKAPAWAIYHPRTGNGDIICSQQLGHNTQLFGSTPLPGSGAHFAPQKKSHGSRKKNHEMFIPTWHHLPVLLGAGPSRTPNHPQQGDHGPLGRPVQSELSKPSGLRVTAAPGEGEGASRKAFGDQGGPRRLLGGCFGTGEARGFFSTRRRPPRWIGAGARRCPVSPLSEGCVRFPRRQQPVQEGSTLSHWRKMRKTLEDFTERLCGRRKSGQSASRPALQTQKAT